MKNCINFLMKLEQKQGEVASGKMRIVSMSRHYERK